MDYHFGEEHHREIGDDLAGKGFPDDGNGRYTQKKQYADWYFMNISKRQRNNNQDNLVVFAPLSLMNGMIFPITTMLSLSGYITGRYFYN